MSLMNSSDVLRVCFSVSYRKICIFFAKCVWYQSLYLYNGNLATYTTRNQTQKERQKYIFDTFIFLALI